MYNNYDRFNTLFSEPASSLFYPYSLLRRVGHYGGTGAGEQVLVCAQAALFAVCTQAIHTMNRYKDDYFFHYIRFNLKCKSGKLFHSPVVRPPGLFYPAFVFTQAALVRFSLCLRLCLFLIRIRSCTEPI